MRNTLILFLPFFLFLALPSYLCGQSSSLVSYDKDGFLVYTPDEKGNVIPDFSMVGYHQGLKSIPDVAVLITLEPLTDLATDRYSDIQSAINEIASLEPNDSGHRGALLLKAGYYPVSRTLSISASGIIIRGEGNGENGTIMEYTSAEQSSFIEFHGSGGVDRLFSTQRDVTEDFVPIGSKTVNVEVPHEFEIGDRVLYSHTNTQEWIELLGMDSLAEICGEGHSSWTPWTLRYRRKIVAVDGSQITFDAPIMEPIEQGYQSSTVVKYSWDKTIEECGIENIRLISSYKSDEDEDHGWTAIEFSNIENSWVRKVKAYYFGFGCVSARGGAYQITVSDCGMYDYKSKVSGGRRYGFNSDDCELLLFENCESDSGRHSFVQGSRTPGPNVYTNCTATNALSDEGPHHRWSTGTLWDNITTDNEINVQNRLCSGSGHGWAGTQQVLWNCTADKIILHDPPLSATNWAIGCTAEITNESRFEGVSEELGYVESSNNPIVEIASLYQAQLENRLKIIASNRQNQKNESIVLIYPNPSSDIFRIKSQLAFNNSIKLSDITGNPIDNSTIYKSDNHITIDLSGFSAGIYLLHIDNQTHKLIKL